MSDLPPHFPDPSANAVALLEAALAERTEELADAHKEAKAWQAQLEAVLARERLLLATIEGLKIGIHTAHLTTDAVERSAKELPAAWATKAMQI